MSAASTLPAPPARELPRLVMVPGGVALVGPPMTVAECFAAQARRQLLGGIVRCLVRRPELLADAPRHVAGAVESYWHAAENYGQWLQRERDAHNGDTQCDCDDDGERCSHCEAESGGRVDLEHGRMRRARRVAGERVSEWLGGGR